MSTRPRSIPFAAALLACACASASAQPHPAPKGRVPSGEDQAVTPPAEHLGRPVGVDFELADWGEVSGYFQLLSGQSPRVLTESVGTTTEGRDFLLTTITSERNLARLDSIRAAAARIADPRGMSAEERERTLSDAVPILMISNAMHSTEAAAPQFAMEFAWKLATSDEEPWASARERLVVVVIPCTNPDGLDEVVSWYRRTVGTPHESSGLTRLYQLYAGHDNNRDWFMLSQAETRIVTRLLYDVWHPHVYWDVHQQGQSGERIFVPPFRDPLNPNLDPAVMAGIGALGSRALLDLTREGYTGVSTGVSYDMWWNGGNRNVPVRHNIIGILTEAASVNLASPVFLRPDSLRGPRGLGGNLASNQFPAPWPGGWWRLRDIIDYELAVGRSLLRSLSAEPRTWLESALAAAERVIEKGRQGAPRAWLVPSDNRDPAAVRRLMDTLLLGGVEVHVATDAFEADGRRWPAGTIVIRRDQPYGSHVKDLFEVQRYPGGEAPYDVAGWTLPLLLGVHRVEVVGAVETALTRARTVDEACAAFRGDGDPARLGSEESDTWPRVFAELEAGRSLLWQHGGEQPGTFRVGDTPVEGESQLVERLPRIGLYTPWSGSMDEGWMRYVLDSSQVPYLRVQNEMLRAGRLEQFLDVLIVPDISARQLDQGRAPGTAPEPFVGGLDPEGAVAVEEFVRGGGTLIAIDGSAAWAIELFGLPLVDTTRGPGAGEFSCPGSVLRAIPVDAPLTRGLPHSVPLFFSRSAAWRIEGEGGDPGEKLEVLLEYAPSRVLLSGWIQAPEVLEGRAAWVRARHGEGRVHLFAFRPQFRGWTQATFQLIFRAALLE